MRLVLQTLSAIQYRSEVTRSGLDYACSYYHIRRLRKVCGVVCGGSGRDCEAIHLISHWHAYSIIV